MEWLTSSCDFLLAASALLSSRELFKDHRAPSVGFFLLGLSAGLGLLTPAGSGSSLQTDAEWAAEVLAPALVSFHLLWLSEDRSTALLLLCGPCLLVALRDSLPADAVVLMTRCAGLASLSCSLTVCLFAGQAAGALASVALSLPSLCSSVGSQGSGAASAGMTRWALKLLLSVGCWTSTRALPQFWSDLTERGSLGL